VIGRELTPAENRRRLQLLRADESRGAQGQPAAKTASGLCPECTKEPGVSGGRCYLCRARSMQP
jgi:hypothetical protein